MFKLKKFSSKSEASTMVDAKNIHSAASQRHRLGFMLNKRGQG